jgi:hypothetical protein
VFDENGGTDLPASLAIRMGAAYLYPDVVGAHHPFWDDLSKLKSYLAKVENNIDEFVLIEVLRMCNTSDCTTMAQFAFVGYDIADEGYLSSLMSCGYEASELSVLRHRFAPSLNEWHLFNDMLVAEQYRETSDLLVAEHAPFAIFRIGLSGFMVPR